jgi:hypothetical protein
MKKVLLFSLILFLTTIAVCAYETIIFHFPDGELWEKAYYKKINYEAILQYVPAGETSNIWTRSIVVHSYNNSGFAVKDFSANEIRKMKRINPNGNYKTLRMRENDAIFTRCTEEYKNIQPHCEFLRITKAHDGIVSIQYMNRNKKDFENNYTLWLETIRGAKFMYSYYRDERTFDKAIYFEL